METREQKIKQILDMLGQPKYRFDQVIEAIYRQNEILNYSEISNLPKELREILTRELGDGVLLLKEVDHQKESQTEKILFETKDGHKIETVKMHYEGGRNTYCVSLQVGCAMGCVFCATGKLGLQRNLTSGEIVDQVLYFKKKGHRVDNVVFMGMGEPLVNPATFEALEIFTDQKKMGIGQRHLSVSTVGIVPGIRQMTKEQPQVNLALSLHSPFQEEREKIMPISKKYHISDVLGALEDHIKTTNRKVLIAYILLGGFNDSEEHAVALSEILNSYGEVRHLFHVNLINYHEVEGLGFKKADTKNVEKFRQILNKKGIRNTLRQDFGEEIDAACGQLSGKKTFGGRDRT